MGDRHIKQECIPYVGQLKLVNVHIEGWIIDPDVYGLYGGPYDDVYLPTHNGEVVHLCVMTCGVGMVINGGRGLCQHYTVLVGI